MAMITLIKESIYLGLAYSFRALSHCHDGGRGMVKLADVVLRK